MRKMDPPRMGGCRELQTMPLTPGGTGTEAGRARVARLRTATAHRPSQPLRETCSHSLSTCSLIHPADDLAWGVWGPHVLSPVTSQTALLY